VSNFSQFVGFYILGTPLKLKLSTAWDKITPVEGSTLVILTQPNVRRTLGIAHTPKSITIQPQDERLEALLGLNSGTSAAHVAKFEAQAAQAKQDKLNRKLIEQLQKNFAALGITINS
jgi:hypothetical protein